MKKTMFIAALLAAGLAQAEVAEVGIAHQPGLAYTAFHVMKSQGLIEKHARALGIEVKASVKNLGSPGVIRDALLAGNSGVQFGAVGVPTLIQLADKTSDWKAVGNIVSLPMYLNSTESVASICDLAGKIAVPTVKTSVQAVTLQMAAKERCGSPFALDAKTVSMTHPDGMTALLNGQIGSHLTSPPFQGIELEKGAGKVKKLLSSYDVLGGSTSFILLVGSEKFKQENPKVFEAVRLAFEEAQAFISKSPEAAADIYIAADKPKDDRADIVRQFKDPEIAFSTTPNGVGKYASFMHEVGTVKKAMTWKDLAFSNLHGRNGS